jgi:hypothetical protein
MCAKQITVFEDFQKNLEAKYLSKGEAKILLNLRGGVDQKREGPMDSEEDDCSWEDVYYNQRCEV